MQQAQAHERYRLVRALGQGAMGSVDLVHDVQLGRDVARKRLRRTGAEDLVRFKTEFRTIEELDHVNLVRLYELGEDETSLYFTMQFIDGIDLRTYCRGGPVEETLARVLPQLLDAVTFLHGNGVVHRDLKPSNILVTADGTLKVLDFGVLAQLGGKDSVIAGTPGYMSPEQLRGEAPSPASDVYALGCLLFEILVGRPVFSGSPETLRTAHLNTLPPAIVAPTLPAHLSGFSDVCRAMLEKRAQARPTTHELPRLLLAPLGIRLPVAAPASVPAQTLLGRAEIQDQLARWLNSTDPMLVLQGPTGVGKTALVDWLAQHAERDGRVVLVGRARPNERVAFNALDAAIDTLSRLVERAPVTSELAAAVGAASVAFPVLRRGKEADAAAVREKIRERLFGIRQGPETSTRHGVFDAVAALIRAVGEPRGVLLAIDDFQWADDDSVALLDHCIDRLRPFCRVLMAVRDDIPAGGAGQWLSVHAERVRVPVPPLDEETMLQIVWQTARQTGADPQLPALQQAAHLANGRPFLAGVLGRSMLASGTPSDPEALLDAAIRGVGGLDRQVMVFSAASDDWLDVATLAELCRAPPAQIVDCLGPLKAQGILRLGGGSTLRATIDLFHDGIRARVLASLNDDERIAAHGALADRLLRTPEKQVERIVRHLIGAGRSVEAAAYARIAARTAESQRAFGLAADMYQVALLDAAEPEREALLESRAIALERVGRYNDAATCWQALAGKSGGDIRIDRLSRQAHALIAAGRTGPGLAHLDHVLRVSGQGGSSMGGLRALAMGARFLLGPARGRPAKAGRKLDLQRGQRRLNLGVLLVFLDPVSGLGFLRRAQRDFLDAGENELAATCDYMFATFAWIGSRRIDRVPLAERYRGAAEARLRDGPRSPRLRAVNAFIGGLCALRQGRWAVARTQLGCAAGLFAEAEGTTEQMMALSWQMMADVYEQDLPAMKVRHAWFSRHAADRDGSFIMAHVELLGGYIALLEGRFEASRLMITALANLFDADRPNTQRAAALLYRHLPDVYAGDTQQARWQYTEALAQASRFRFFGSMYAGPLAQIGGLLEANALRVGDPEASIRRVRRYARVIESAPPLVAGVSFRARAYAADAQGRPEEAIRHLETAEREAEKFGRSIDAAIARHQRGLRVGGDAGEDLKRSARDVLRAAGASELLLDEDAGRR